MARPARNPEGLQMEDEILAAAEQLFLEKGFALTSTTEIARRARCNQALVHYYFRTKEQLFERIFQDKVRMFIGRFLGVYEQGITFEEKICAMVDAHFDMLIENPKLPSFIINELAASPERIKKLKENVGGLPVELFARFSGDLQKEVAAGRVRDMDWSDMLLTVLSLDVMPFLISPVLRPVMGDDAYTKMLAGRAGQVKLMLLKSIRI